MFRLLRLLGVLAFCVLLAGSAWAQGLFATLTGVVSDPSGAVVANAKVTLRDVQSGSERETVTNSDGYYTFASVPVGAYSLQVELAGFKSYKEDGLRLGGGERRNVNVTLNVGGTSETVEVTGQDISIAPVDSGEKSFTLETKELQNFTQVGSNAAEYIKIAPGFSVFNASNNSNKANYTGQTIGINANGDSGSQSPLNDAYTYNGLPPNTLDIVADGAHVSDPGCNCDTPVNPNSDFLQEFKILTSNFSAEDQKGPAVITSVTKAGGNTFHGNAFLYARNYVLNANDAFNDAQTPVTPKPANKYYYPGGSIGGPVIIPGTSFNKNRDKLFFFTGFEYFYQVLDTGLLRAIVPTSNEINGDFSANSIAGEGPTGSQLDAAGLAAFGGTQVPANQIDTSMQNLMKLYPSPNATPSIANPFNYVQAEVFNQNNTQWTTRVDYNVSQNTKVFVRYNFQRETQLFPVGLWWRQSDQVPYPTSIEGKNKSDSWTGTITHVFSPSMTNETVMAYTFVGFPNIFADPTKVDRGAVGYTDPSLFPGRAPQIPSFGGNGGNGEAALVFNPGGFEAGGNSQGLYANKYMPSISDTLTKVWRTHTFKAGFFYEWIRNAQPASNNTNGYLQFVPSSNIFSYGNAYADMLTGNMSQYQETSFNRINDISYNTVEGFIQDSWKVRRKLTIELGLRLTHFSPWVDDENFGYAIFDPSQYSSASNGACAAGPTFCGFEWHARSNSVPLGGFATRTLFYQPRFGVAYDVFGNGNTVVRGGWGRFYFHSGQFTAGLDASAGVASLQLNPNTTVVPGHLFADQLDTINVPAAPATPSGVDANDDRQPYNDSYSFTIAQKTPFQGLLEVAYVGNQSSDLLNTGGAGSNINLVPQGAMFNVAQPGNADPAQYRPLPGYGDLNIATNNLYANYNSLQVSWLRHAGRYTIQANYALQKALGIVSLGNPASGSNVGLNQLNLGSNYGVQSGNRTHVLNLAYSIQLGNPVHDNKFAGGAVNGWQVSGVTQVESGQNITYNTNNANFNFTLAGPGGSGAATDASGDKINNQYFLGTNAIQLNPIVTCNPASGLGAHQWVNPQCFGVGSAQGQAGPALLPVVYGPAYFSWDLSLFKNFKITESKSLQFRIQGYNFLNHPLWSFPGNENLNLKFDQTAVGSTSFVLDPATSANFGTALHKEGHRVLELAMKFYF
ncbi:MAG TPA: carboxypeptidase-like regulatory domain-containing protein [Terriglobales bacterium]|nr:carboxypeptidase-like regulatory domain-containing protein [Terriglobales bacterium]